MKRSVKGFNWTVARSAVILVSVALLALAGCGSRGSSTAGSDQSTLRADRSTPAITKAELIGRGDAICRKTDMTQKAAVNAYSKQNPGKLLGKANQEVILKKVAFPPIAVEIEELSALGAPQGDEGVVDAIITGLETALDEAQSDPSTLLVGFGEGPFAKPDKLAGKYGFKDCAKAL